MNQICLTDEIRAEILALADADWKAADIADEVGLPVWRIYRVAAGRLKAKSTGRTKDLGRLRRIVRAGDTIPKGERHDLGGRFGLKDSHSFRGVLSYARKALASEVRA